MPRRHNKVIRKANRIEKRWIIMDQNRNNDEDGTAPPVAAVTTACRKRDRDRENGVSPVPTPKTPKVADSQRASSHVLPTDNAVLTEIETAEVLPAATEDDAVMIRLPTDNAVLAEIETAEVSPAATEDDAVMIRLPTDNAVLTEIETAEVLPAATEDDAVMICLAQEARAKVHDVIKQFKVDICNRFKAKEIEQANKIAEAEKKMKEMMIEIDLLKKGLVKITDRHHQTQVESGFVKFILTPKSTPLEPEDTGKTRGGSSSNSSSSMLRTEYFGTYF